MSSHQLSMVSIIVILFSSHFFLSPTLAQQQQQPYTPHVVRTPQYLAVNEKTLYIQGGQNASRNSVNQFFALDLTQPWPVSNPAWISLPLGGSSSSPGANNTPSAPTQSQQSITLSQDGQNLMFWSNKANQSISIFNMHSQTWQAPIPNPPGLTQINGLVALTDPTTGNIYVPNGAANMTVGGPKMMQVFNPVIKSSDLRAMPETSQMPSGVVFYTFVWSSVLNGMIMYGGNVQYAPVPYPNSLFLYTPSKDQWALLNAKGPSPGDIYSHCAVLMYNGTKMVVFGGINALNGVQGGLYILDIASNTWTQRKPAFPADWRRGMACGAADDYFVAWGGDTGFAGNLVTLTPIIYNVATDQWTNNFRGPNTLPQPGSSNTGAIIGGSVGGLLALAILGLFVYKRHQKHKRINGKTKVNRDSAGMALTDNDVYGSNYAQRRAAGRVASIPAVERHALGPPNHPHSVLLEHVDEENKRRSCEEDGGSDPLQPPPNIVVLQRSLQQPSPLVIIKEPSGKPQAPHTPADVHISYPTMFSNPSANSSTMDAHSVSPSLSGGTLVTDSSGSTYSRDQRSPQSFYHDGTIILTPQVNRASYSQPSRASLIQQSSLPQQGQQSKRSSGYQSETYPPSIVVTKLPLSTFSATTSPRSPGSPQGGEFPAIDNSVRAFFVPPPAPNDTISPYLPPWIESPSSAAVVAVPLLHIPLPPRPHQQNEPREQQQQEQHSAPTTSFQGDPLESGTLSTGPLESVEEVMNRLTLLRAQLDEERAILERRTNREANKKR